MEMKELQDGIKVEIANISADLKGLLETQARQIKDDSDKVNLENKTRIDDLNTKLDEQKAELVKLQTLSASAREERSESDFDPKFGFKNVGEFMVCAIKNSKNNTSDERLQKLMDYEQEVLGNDVTEKGFLIPPAFRKDRPASNLEMEHKELSAGVGAEGGFFIPVQTGAPVKAFEPRPGVFRPRSTVIPAGSPPDAEIQMPALDQGGSKGVYAGLTVAWLNEGDAKSESDFDSRQIKLKPNEVAAYITITDKLLRNAPALGVIAQNMLRGAILSAEDQAFYNGSGAGQPLGLIGHASVILQGRATLNQVNYADIVNMYSQIVFGGSYVWVVSQSVLPQLMTMQDGAGQLIWQPNAVVGLPGTLLGLPVIVNNRSVTLGNEGDVLLADLSYYYIKDGSGLFIASSEHVQFVNNKTLIKAFWNVDGQPAITSPLEDEDGADISPFVVLDNVTAS